MLHQSTMPLQLDKQVTSGMLQGDHNQSDDRLLYNRGQRWLNASHIMGRVVGYAPPPCCEPSCSLRG